MKGFRGAVIAFLTILEVASIGALIGITLAALNGAAL